MHFFYWLQSKRPFSICLVLLIAGTLLLIPLTAKAQYAVFDPIVAGIDAITAAEITALTFKEYVIDPTLRAIAHAFLNRYLNQIQNRIATHGRGGNPQFVQDWREFQLLGQYRGESLLRAMVFDAIDQGVICPEVVPALQRSFTPREVQNADTILQRVNSLQPYAVKAKCTLPTDLPSLDQDFAGGGSWDTFLRRTAPQNHPAGIALITSQELENQRAIEEQADVQEAVSGGGYLSLKTGCESEVRPPDIDIWLPRKTCKLLGHTVTPATWIQAASNKKIQSGIEWILEADELEELITAIISTIIERAWSDQGLTDGRGFSAGDPAGSGGTRPDTNIAVPPGEDNPTCDEVFNEDICEGGGNLNPFPPPPPPPSSCTIQCSDGSVVSCSTGCPSL